MFPQPAPSNRQGLLLYVLQPDNTPELREGLAEVMARYPDRFVPPSGEGAGTALPVTFHRMSSNHQTPNIRNVDDEETESTGGDELKGHRGVKCIVDATGALRVYFSHRADAFRALGRLMVAAHNAPFGARPGARAALAAGMQFEETPWLELMGVQLDCSRGGVPHVAALQDWAVQLALYGFNALLLYMEDVYEVSGETFFGYMRGRYSSTELAQVGRVAAAVGVEVIPAIQTLGHLEQVLHWPANAKYRDTPGVFLAGEEEGHDLLERMMTAVTKPLRARRIHLGLDEAFGLGQGKYREKRCGTQKTHGFGAECGPTPEAALIYEEHVQRVLDTARGLGLRPAVYTDMIFRFGAGGGGTAGGDGGGDGQGAYRDPDKLLSPETVERVNAALGEEALDLVYWDYSSSSKEQYMAQLGKHEPLLDGNNTADGRRRVVMSLGLWTWNRFWAALHWAMTTMEAGVAAAQDVGVRGMYVAAWADDGAEHAPISAAAGVAFFAELVRLNPQERSRPNVLQRTEESFPVIMRSGGVSFKDVLDTCAIDQAPGVPTGWGTTNLAKWLLWEDPLLAHLSPQVANKDMVKHYRQLASALDRRIGVAMRGNGGGGGGGNDKGVDGDATTAEEARWAHPLAFPAALAKVLARKLAFRRDLHEAYGSKNILAMSRLIGYSVVPSRRSPFGQSTFLGWGRGGDVDNTPEAAEAVRSGVSNTTLAALREIHAATKGDAKVTSGRDGMGAGGGGELGALLSSLLRVQHLHRGMWRAHYKPHGWEVIESRYGTLRARLEGVGDLIQSLLEGRITAIEELETPPGSPARPPRVYNAEVHQLPLMCWARAVTPAMPSIRSDSACSL